MLQDESGRFRWILSWLPLQGHSWGVALGCLFCEIILFYVPIIQVTKTHEIKESTCNKSFPVLDSYLLHLQDLTSAVDHILVRN